MKRTLLLLLILALYFTACQKEERAIIRIGVMPDAGALPLLLMNEVEIIPFMSASERDAALQAGQLDAIMTDLISVVRSRDKEVPLKALSVTESRFILLAHPDSSMEDPWTIGISENSIIEFMVDQLASDHKLEKVAIPQVPVRMEMLRSKQIPMACLTDVMAWPLLSQGFPIIRDQKGSHLNPAVLAFTQSFLEENPSTVKNFQREWNSLVKLINQSPGDFRPLLLEQVRLPENIDHPYPMPQFQPIRPPNQETVDGILGWYEQKYGLETRPTYEDLLVQP